MERSKRVFAALAASALLLLLSLTVVGSNASANLLMAQAGNVIVPAAPTNNFDQFVIVLMENHDISDIYGPAPYMTQLADQNAFSQHWASITNPSQPNYIALIGGSTFGVSGDGNHPNLNYPTLVDIIENSGHTWNAIAEGSGSGCSINPNRGEDHFPFLSYTTITGNTARCANLHSGGPTDVVAALNAGTSFIWFTPNDSHNMHDNSVASGDSWLQSWVPGLLSAMAAKHATLFITYDEGYASPPLVYSGFSGPSAKQAYKSTTSYTHYSLLKLIEDVWGGGNLGQGDVNAASPVEFFLPGGPEFSLTANPTSVSFGTGQSASSTISLSSSGGFPDPVYLTAVSVPAGVTTSFVPSSLSGNGTSACTLTANMPGSYVVTITGTNGTLVHTAAIDATVSPPDFSLTANPNSVSFVVNNSAASTITLQSTGGFSGSVSLNASSSPSGVTTSCSPSTLVRSQSSTCTMNATTIGSYTVSIKGTNGNLTHSASIGVSVTPVPQPDLSLTVNPAAISFASGDSGWSTISVAATGGFSGTVSLTSASNPLGLTTVCSPATIQGSQVAICTIGGRTTGQFKVVVTGTSGSLVRSVPISVNVLPGEPKPDTIPPEVTITFPSNATLFPYETVTVHGNAFDNVAIQKVELSTDNLTWIRTNGTASWSGNLTLTPGTTSIYAR